MSHHSTIPEVTPDYLVTITKSSVKARNAYTKKIIDDVIEDRISLFTSDDVPILGSVKLLDEIEQDRTE